jgi:hypothetical protein
VKPEIEIRFLFFYRRPPGEGWFFAALSVVNFDNGASWELLSIDRAPNKWAFNLF